MINEEDDKAPSFPKEKLEGDANTGVGANNRESNKNTPETGWEAGAGISNSQFIKADYDDVNDMQRGPSEAGIGMAEIRKKQEEGSWGSGSGSGLKGTAGSEAGT